MNSSPSSHRMGGAAQSALDPNSADYYPQQYRTGGGGGGGGGYSSNSASNNTSRGGMYGSAGSYASNNGGGGGGNSRGGGGLNANNSNNLLTNVNGTYYPNATLVAGSGGVGMYALNGRVQNGNRAAGGGSGGGNGNNTGGVVHGVVYSQHAVNHAGSPSQLAGGYGSGAYAAGGPASSGLYGGSSHGQSSHGTANGNIPLPRTQQRGQQQQYHQQQQHHQGPDLFAQFATSAPTALRDEWVGETPKSSPAVPDVPADQLQGIFEQLLSADSSLPPSTTPVKFNSKNTPSLGALSRGEVAPDSMFTPTSAVDVDLSDLIAHLPSTDSMQQHSSSSMPAHTTNGNGHVHHQQQSPQRVRGSAAAAILRSPQRDTMARTPLQHAGGHQLGGRSPDASPSTAAAFAHHHSDGIAASIGGLPARGGAHQQSSSAPPGASAGSGLRYTSAVELPDESPPIHISAHAFIPTPEVSPSMAPSNIPHIRDTPLLRGADGGGGSATMGSARSPAMASSDVAAAVLPPSVMVPAAQLAVRGEPDASPSLGGATEAESSSIPPPAAAAISSAAAAAAGRPNLASLLSGTAKPAGPPPGSMAEKLLLKSGGAAPAATSGAVAAAKKPATPTPAAAAVAAPSAAAAAAGATNSTVPSSAAALPTTKAAIERFLKDGDAPETLRHIKILAFSHDYPSDIKALFELWAGNGIPPPDDAFGAYYWYVRKKIGRDLCMKHNGPGKAPGVGYGGCDYASRGQGQCRYHHQCLFCTKEDHGWFDEQKCGRYKTYQKELAKLKLTEDHVYELVESYCAK